MGAGTEHKFSSGRGQSTNYDHRTLWKACENPCRRCKKYPSDPGDHRNQARATQVRVMPIGDTKKAGHVIHGGVLNHMSSVDSTGTLYFHLHPPIAKEDINDPAPLPSQNLQMHEAPISIFSQ